MIEDNLMDGFLFPLLFAAALGCGLIGGVFFAFSAFVMRGLARIPPGQGIAAMQSINVVVINPVFLGGFLETAAACAALVAVFWGRAGAGWVLAGSLLYLVGTVGVTMLCNVPRNDVLARVDAASAEGGRVWAEYVAGWTAWNHVRTVAAMAASALLMVGMI